METMKFEEAFKERSQEVKDFVKMIANKLHNQTIIDFEYGLDADGDPQLYYIVLDNGIKIGMARVYQYGKVKELDRTERYKDGSIIRFQFLNWPGDEPK